MRSGDADIAFSVRGSGPSTLVLIMGLGATAADWGEPFLDALAAQHRVVAFDNRGTGTSSRLAGPVTLEQMAADAVAVMDAVGAEKAHVGGISMGGMIAQHVALDFPKRVRKLVLLSTHCGGTRALLPLPHIVPVMFPAPGTPPDVIVRNRLTAIAAPGWATKNEPLLEAWVQMALAAPTPVRTYRAQLDAIMRADRYSRLDDIDAPTLVLHGDADPLIPHGNAEILARRIPEAQLVTLPGVGHLPTWEAPDETAGAILGFLS